MHVCTKEKNTSPPIPHLKAIELWLPPQYERLKGALGGGAIFGWKISKDGISSLVTNHFGKYVGDITGKGLDAFTEKIIPPILVILEVYTIQIVNSRLWYVTHKIHLIRH
jgi:hypothetical protein